MRKDTSWGGEFVTGTYQKDLILPNLIRLLDIKKGEVILDLGCGPGFFAKEFAKNGARILGVDLSEKLIAEAKRNVPDGNFFAGSAEDLSAVDDESVDKIVAVLSIQNMDNLHKVFTECRRVLKTEGQLFIVMTHPAFRIPRQSEWGWDDVKNIQYRRVDSYMSESKERIQMHPGDKPSEYTITFHRPLQFYFKLLGNNGFCVCRLEEWISPKVSEPGPKAKAENRARMEIPLFLFLGSVKF